MRVRAAHFRTCCVRRHGLVPYAEALSLQERLVASRQAGSGEDTLLLLEHPRVLTLGRNGRREHVLLSAEQLRSRGFELFEVGRGGDVTYHGPGQLVGYPILRLEGDERDAHRHLRRLEELLIRVLADFDISGFRHPPHTGVWVEEAGHRRKIAAIGVRLARWVSSHGFALNVSCDLADFGVIVPCGIKRLGVTSMEQHQGTRFSIDEVAQRVVAHFGSLFHRNLEFDSGPSGSAVEFEKNMKG